MQSFPHQLCCKSVKISVRIESLHGTHISWCLLSSVRICSPPFTLSCPPPLSLSIGYYTHTHTQTNTHASTHTHRDMARKNWRTGPPAWQDTHRRTDTHTHREHRHIDDPEKIPFMSSSIDEDDLSVGNSQEFFLIFWFSILIRLRIKSFFFGIYAIITQFGLN